MLKILKIKQQCFNCSLKQAVQLQREDQQGEKEKPIILIARVTTSRQYGNLSLFYSLSYKVYMTMHLENKFNNLLEHAGIVSGFGSFEVIITAH